MIAAIEVLAVIWTALAALGFATNVFAVKDARLDRVTVEKWSHVGTRLIVAKANQRREVIRCVKQLILGIAGVFVIASPPPPANVAEVRIVLSVTYILVTAGIVANTLWDRHDRKRLLEEIVRQDEERLDHPD